MAAPEIRWMRIPLDDADRESALRMLSAEERARYELAAEPHRETFLAGRLLLRSLAGDLLGTPPATVVLAADCPDCDRQHGRPTLPGTSLHMSLSHTDGLVAAAASWGSPVGIDIEHSPPAAGRLEAIASLTGVASLAHWTRVEAVLKADGRGLRVDPGDVALADGVARVRGDESRYAVTDLDLADDVTGSVAVRL